MDVPNKDSKKTLPLFTPRKNGAGWDLNIGSRLSYIVLAIILAVPFVVVILCLVLVKH